MPDLGVRTSEEQGTPSPLRSGGISSEAAYSLTISAGVQVIII